VLRRSAARLTTVVRGGDIVARLGADEFVVVAEVEGIDVAVGLGQRMVTSLAGAPSRTEPGFGEPAGTLTASVGVAMTFDGSDTPTELLHDADAAVRRAKKHGAGRVEVFDEDLRRRLSEQSRIEQALRRAMEQDQLRLHYQPKIQAGSSELEGFEALLRWQHPRYGLLPPAEFLPLAEYTSLMGMLTDWVLDTALAQLIDWGDDMKHLTMSVNVSARNLTEPSFVQRVGSVLRRYRIPPSRLVLEVTETAMFVDPQHVRATLADLDHAGVRISLDDFGQGQTSLRFLSGLPLSEVKIDRVFVRDMVSLPSHTAIVRSVVALSYRLGLTVVAEGVEDAAALAALEAMGCDSIQGFLIARPMPPDQVPSWVSDRIESATARSLWTPSRPESHTTSTARAASIG